jgi:hypothetical protein
VRTALRGAPRGLYMLPYCMPKDMKSPAMQEKYQQGPIAMVTVMPNGRPAMFIFLSQWFAYCIIISYFVAYLAAHTIAHGAPYLAVFRVVGTAGFLAYGLGFLSDSIWKGQPWSMTLKQVFDGLIYGLVTAGTFGWLWPR